MRELRRINARLREKISLTKEETRFSIDALLNEKEEKRGKKEFLIALSDKGETTEELYCFVEYFLQKAKKLNISISDFSRPLIDVCGTGGDRIQSFNITTTSMFVAAAAGAIILKHGNRKITSLSGSADVLEEIGIPLDLKEEVLKRCLEETGIAFLFAPNYHPDFGKVAPLRRELAKENRTTIFNLLGPLLNPVKLEFQLMGISKIEKAEQFGLILKKLGRKKSWIVFGKTEEGEILDELSIMGKNQILEFTSEEKSTLFNFYPKDFNLKTSQTSEILGGAPQENAKILLNILSNREKGAKLEIVLLNSAAMLTCCGVASSLQEGLEKGKEVIENGHALANLKHLQKILSSSD